MKVMIGSYSLEKGKRDGTPYYVMRRGSASLFVPKEEGERLLGAASLKQKEAWEEYWESKMSAGANV
jgi:hypothetical protein